MAPIENVGDGLMSTSVPLSHVALLDRDRSGDPAGADAPRARRWAAALLAVLAVAASGCTLSAGPHGARNGTASLPTLPAIQPGTQVSPGLARKATARPAQQYRPARDHRAAPPPASLPAPAANPAVPQRSRSRQGGTSPAEPTVLLSQGHPATASSVEGSHWAPNNAVDGNTGTRWSSAWSDPQWLEVDLGATHTLRKVVLDWENAYATAFQIQVSGNGTTWTSIYSTTIGTGGVQTIPASGKGRYVRMYGTHRANGYGYSLWEFQVFGR